MENSTRKILELIKKSNSSKSKIEKACGLSNGSIGKWEKGSYNPSYGAIVKIADYFNISPDYLLGRTDEPIPQKTQPVVIMAKGGDGQDVIEVSEEQYQKIKKILELMDEQNL